MQTVFAKSALALAATGALIAAVPAVAAPASHAGVSSHVVTGAEAAWNDRGHRRDWQRHDRYDDRRHDDRRYGDRRYDDNNRGYYRDQVNYGTPVYANTQVWQGRDGRNYCRRADGTTGLLIGAAVGGVVGHEVAGRRGDRTLGVILGAAGGALLGRAIDRGGARCR